MAPKTSAHCAAVAHDLLPTACIGKRGQFGTGMVALYSQRQWSALVVTL